MRKKIVTMALMTLVATMGNSIAFANLLTEDVSLPSIEENKSEVIEHFEPSPPPTPFHHYVDKKIAFAKEMASKQIIFEQDQKAENFINKVDKDKIVIGDTEIVYTDRNIPNFGASISRTDCDKSSGKVKIKEDLYMFVASHDTDIKYINVTYRDPVTNFIVHNKVKNLFGSFNVPQEKDFVKIVKVKYKDAYTMPIYISLEFVDKKGHSSHALVRYNVAFDKNNLQTL